MQPWRAPKGGTDVTSFNVESCLVKLRLQCAIAELHIALNYPNETIYINSIRSSSIVNFPYPMKMIRYYYRVHLIENPCIICARSKMTKPKNYYLLRFKKDCLMFLLCRRTMVSVKLTAYSRFCEEPRNPGIQEPRKLGNQTYLCYFLRNLYCNTIQLDN